MALFEDVEIVEVNSNQYLSDPEKGLELLKNILKIDTQNIINVKFEAIVKNELFPVLANLNLGGETEIYRKLLKLCDKIRETSKLEFIDKKCTIGIGGGFSSGKSAFINALTNVSLPEDQDPTTSVATYIISAQEKKNIIISNSNNFFEADDDAIEAIAHQFQREYGLGFAGIIKNIVVFSNKFKYENIAILDTPGYSKADGDLKADSLDFEKAAEQLRAVDYLIWLTQSNNVIKNQDIDFIRSLTNSNKILFVFSMADLVTESDLKQKIDNARKRLSEAGIEIYDIIAYNSKDGKTVIGDEVLEKYFDEIDKKAKNKKNLREQLDEISDEVHNLVNDKIKKLRDFSQHIGETISKVHDPEHIDAIIDVYSSCNSQISTLLERINDFDVCIKKLCDEISEK